MIPVPAFNEQVVREALLNAVSHRDYQLSGSIFIRQYNNRIVIENPGGFPWGITIENILDRQAARNNCIADVFQLCGLVERAGQGMNMIFEQSIREAKPLPDFCGSDTWFTKLTLHGKAFDQRMLAHMKKLSDEQLISITKEDYSLLAAFYHGKGLEHIHASQYDHLAELGIVCHSEHGIELVDSGIMLLLGIGGQTLIDGQSTANQRPISDQLIGANNKKQGILDYIAANGQVTSSHIAQYTGLSRTRVREILQELVTDGIVKKIGNYRYASYSLKNYE